MTLETVLKNAGWAAVGSLLFCIVFFTLICQVPLLAFLAAAALIPAGGFVVGALITLSFEEEHPTEEH